MPQPASLALAATLLSILSASPAIRAQDAPAPVSQTPTAETKDAQKAEHKHQKAQEKAAKANAKAAKDQAKTLKDQDKAQQAAEKAQSK